ncbi:MAG: chromosome segregation protein SMC [Bacteroidetes bacterium]|nr:chromosome segregation protein SMC [Bacteroidota bacterium]
MYLSKLEIQGFKSFAQRVSLSFDSGISAIVGPNGCGKTNIVDAIRWVLGEQRYSALRSEKMEDVIFNGTKARKPLGMAEASLVIENTKGILPSEYAQVTIGRRIYRSGESEYLLNKVPCRLKDILDLFMDTGMGADAYSVIELKMIETILSDRTDERRRLFEEAAGVTKYKHRRKAAYRKLESVQADLLRVNDLVAEVQKAVNTLERQARRAQQFNEVKDRLRMLEVDLLEREYAQVFARLEPLQAKHASLRQQGNLADADLAGVETSLEDLRSAMLTSEKLLAEAQRDASLHREKIHRVEERNLVAGERTKALHALVQRLEQEEQELRQERLQQETLREEHQGRLKTLGDRERQLQDDQTSRQTEFDAIERRLEEKNAEVKSLNDSLIALVHRIAERQSEQDRQQERIDAIAQSMKEVEEENLSYTAELQRLADEIAALTDEDRQRRRSFAEAEVRFYDAEKRKQELRGYAESLQQEQAGLRSDIDRAASRIDFLQSLMESREGFAEGVRFLSKSDRWQPVRKLTVADALHADEQYRVAIEAALGEAAGLIIVDRVADAEQGIVLLQQEQKGKATFVCLDKLPRITRDYRLPSLPGVLGWALDLAQFDREFAPLFGFLLDRVLVVKDLSTAEQVSAAASGIRCVTLQGEISTTVGLVRGGSRRHDEGGTIGKQHQVEDLKSQIAELSGKLESLERDRAAVLAEHDGIDLRLLTEEVKGIEKEMHGVEMRIAQLAFERKRAEETIEANHEHRAKLAAEIETLRLELGASRPELEAAKAEKQSVDERIEAAARELAVLEEEWTRQSRVVQELGIALVQVRNDHQTSENDLQRAGTAIADILESLEKHRMDAEQARQSIVEVEKGVEENRLELERLFQDLTILESRRTDAEDQAGRQRNEIHAAELRIRDQRRLHDESLRTLHDTELKIAELQARAQHLTDRAREEFELVLELKTYPESEFVDFAALREEIQGLKDRLRTLGNINFAAFEEYTQEKQRLEFMSSQRQDLLEAEKTLLATIEEINVTAQKKFLDTFALIRSNFIETFKSLFDPGDECDLRLEDEVDPLEARIEIVAKPRGKRPTSIDLLSGGEKTLTATALLFAIYLVKPSPFCILDEVDAPLDDANIDRFTRILRKFSENTQFIVVTHNKRTMEAANAMYGVTMEEEGVSKLVTVRFNQGTQITSASVASA